MFNRYTIPGNLLIGSGAASEIPGLVKANGCRPLIIMSEGFSAKVPQAGVIANECRRLLPQTQVYYKERGEPDTVMVDKAGTAAGEFKPDIIVSIGGGSVIDFAKAVSALSRHKGASWVDFQLKGKTIEHRLPFHIAVPTTAGTGSEATKVSVIANKQEAIKKSVAYPEMVPDSAVLDPILTEKLPREIAALTAMDALSHALESLVSLNARPYTEELSLAAMRLIHDNLMAALAGDVEARENMLLSSYFAGVTLNSGVGAAHILAQPISAITGISHSAAITCLLPEVIAVNAEYAPEKYAQFSGIFGLKGEPSLAKEALLNLYKQAGLKCRLSDYGAVKYDLFERIIQSVEKSTMHIKCNPRPVNHELLYGILKRIK